MKNLGERFHRLPSCWRELGLRILSARPLRVTDGINNSLYIVHVHKAVNGKSQNFTGLFIVESSGYDLSEQTFQFYVNPLSLDTCLA